MSTPICVLQSFPEPRPTTNPYVVMLRRSLTEQPDLQVLTFTWRRALRSRYDVFHVHWPDILVSGRDRTRTVARQAAFALLLLRLWTRSTPVVATVHNLRPQEGLSRTQRFLLGLLARRTTVRVHLNEQTPAPSGAATVTVLHGHYRDWFAARPSPPAEPHRACYAGFIRPYKNVAALIRAFGATAEQAPQARLAVAGRPMTTELADELRAAAADDVRVELSLDFLSDEELVAAVGRASLVVLPYREMHNSGAALMALSLDRPVLVPDNEVNEQLATEVGADWVLRYRGELNGPLLLQALSDVQRIPAGARPDLSRREWSRAGQDHGAAYRRALGRTTPTG
ncbi:glycosyltransferase [Modestobacter sp. VKM Ac-2983]|uniref:glycosyltransferase n=1 Tax=Modestobacter sp. VKM Ac-2983 TaxID=3004137 RepID=UPI0022AB69FD|nr:glycosyltransferase [Modestobacter sp. VKM Ac-2983]MCZ2804101.1 glycosyltransferase [Modestobacter sp. VKM Ac-2983]